MTDYAIFDASSGARISPAAGPAAHAQTGGSFKDIYYGMWNPVEDVESSDPHDQPAYETDEKPSTGPIPENIITRAADHDFDFAGDEDTIGDDGDEFEPGDLDGDDVAQDQPLHDEDCPDCEDGPTAGNIVTDAEVFDCEEEDDCLEEDCEESHIERGYNISVPVGDDVAAALRRAFGPGPISRSRM